MGGSATNENSRCSEIRERDVATYFVLGIGAKVRCTYVQPGQGRTPRASGPAESFVQNRACTEPGRTECIELEMTVAAASATLVAHFGPPRCTFGRLRLHSACINPRDRPREAPPSAMSNAARGLAAARANSCARARRRKPGERLEEAWTEERESGGRRKKGPRGIIPIVPRDALDDDQNGAANWYQYIYIYIHWKQRENFYLPHPPHCVPQRVSL